MTSITKVRLARVGCGPQGYQGLELRASLALDLSACPDLFADPQAMPTGAATEMAAGKWCRDTIEHGPTIASASSS